MLSAVAKSLSGFKLYPTTCNRVYKRTQHVTFQQCWELLANNLCLFAQGFMAEPKYETGEKNVLYIQGCDDLISTKMCGHKIIHERV